MTSNGPEDVTTWLPPSLVPTAVVSIANHPSNSSVKNVILKDKLPPVSLQFDKSAESVCVEQVGSDGLPIFSVSVPPSETSRKGSFMITRVIAKDVLDDLDDTTNTEDANSVVLDVSRLTEVPSSTDTLHTPDDEVQWPSSPRVSTIAINQSLSPAELHDDAHSRFRIVKIESRDRWHRGRWTCHDFADPPVEQGVAQSMGAGGNGFVGAAMPSGAPIYYIPGVHDNCKSPFGIVYCDSGVPVLEPSLLASPLYARGVQFFGETTASSRAGGAESTIPDVGVHLHGGMLEETQLDDPVPGNITSSPAVRQLFSNDETTGAFRPLSAPSSESVIDRLQAHLLVSDNQQGFSLPNAGSASNLASVGNVLSRTNSQFLPLDAMMSVTLNLSANSESNGSGAVAIDNKIEQAMDLVKSHLMFAVREEVDLLKEKIKELLERNDQLIRENSFLREHATPDTLALLSSTSVSPQ